MKEFEQVPLEERLQVIAEMPELDCPTQTNQVIQSSIFFCKSVRERNVTNVIKPCLKVLSLHKVMEKFT